MSKEYVLNELFNLCQDFIRENEIRCAEDIHQMDHVIENAYAFIEEICEIVGYYEEKVK